MAQTEVLSPPGELRLKITTLKKFLGVAGCRTQAAEARYLHLGESTWSRFASGVRRPSQLLIVAVLTAFPTCDFTDFFEIATDGADEDAA